MRMWRATLPFTVHGAGQLRGGTVTLDAGRQFVSGLLLSVHATQGSTWRHNGPLPSMPTSG